MASSTLGLLFKIDADSAAAKKELKEFRDVVDKETKDLKASGSFDAFAKSLGLSAEQASKLQVALPIVGAAITAVAGAAVAGAGAIFSIAKATSDAGSRFVDLSEKTGLSAKTLSALDFAAQQTNSSIEDLSQGVILFQRTIIAAAQGSEEAKDKLKRLGIDPLDAIKDFEGALSKAFKTINDAPDGIAQTSLALDAFGRSGANLKGIIKATEGDIAGLIKKATELGVVFSDHDARNADEFGDNLAILTLQAKGLLNTFGKELLPVMIQGMKDISNVLKNNRESFKEWGTEVANVMRAVKISVQTEQPKILTSFREWAVEIFKIITGLKAIELAWKGLNIAGSQTVGQVVQENQKQLTNDVSKPSVDENAFIEEANKKRKALAEEKLKTLESQFSEEKRIRDAALEQLKKNLEATGVIGETTWNTYIEADKRAYAAELAISAIRHNLRAQETEDEATRQQILTQLHIDTQKIFEETKKRNETLIQELTDKRLSNDVAANQRILALTEATTQREIAAFIAKGQTNEAVADFIYQKEIELFDKKKQILEREKELRSNNAEDVKRIENELAILAEQRLKIELEQEDNLFQARIKDMESLKSKAQELLSTLPLVGEGIASQIAPASSGALDNIQTISIWAEAVNTLTNKFAELYQQLALVKEGTDGLSFSFSDLAVQSANILFNALTQVANAIGSVINQWVLYGTTGPAVMRKILAAALASIAAEAAVRAIYATALGFFLLATFQYDKAAAAFTSAAIWGGIALGTGLAGRAIAGNAFQQASNSGATASGRSSAAASGSGSSGGTNVINANIPTQPEMTIRLMLDSNGVLKVAHDDYKNNGIMRQMMLKVVEG